MDQMDNVARVADALVAKYEEGNVVDHQWLDEQFGVPPKTARMSRSEAEQISIQRFALLEGLKRLLLKRHGVLLQSSRGEGYKWVAPDRRAAQIQSQSFHKSRRELKAGLAKMDDLLPHLTRDQKQEASEIAGHMQSAMAALTSYRLTPGQRASKLLKRRNSRH